MLTLEELRHALKDRRIPLIAQATGLHYNTVADVRDNEDANPTYKVLKALNDYFKDNK